MLTYDELTYYDVLHVCTMLHIECNLRFTISENIYYTIADCEYNFVSVV